MANRYRLTANVTSHTMSDADATALVTGALHPAAIVERADAVTVAHTSVIAVAVDLLLAGEGEARDSVARVERITGPAPVDAVRYRLLKADA